MATKRCGTCLGRRKLRYLDLETGKETSENCPTCNGSGEVTVPDDPPPAPPKPPALSWLRPRKKK